jgi:hypothetical protein
MIALVALIVAAVLVRNKLLTDDQTVPLLHAAPIPEFTAYKTLDDFVGVDCFYTRKFSEPLTILGQSTQVNLPPMSRVLVKEIVQESADYDHPGSRGFRVHMMTRDTLASPNSSDAPSSLPPLPVLHTMLVLFPVIDMHNQIVELPLCPVASCQKARDLWLNKQFKFFGDKTGDIDPGAVVTVADVVPAGLGSAGMRFELSLRLSTGVTVTKSMSVDDIVQALRQ